jgi:hypothetical protein
LSHGSRFGGRHERGIWYGSSELKSAFAEVAYYRLVFIEGSSARLGTITTALTAFTVLVKSLRGIDLTVAPFDKYRKEIASPDSYVDTQQLGNDMREADVEAFLYPSARDRGNGINVGAFTPNVFGRSRPKLLETWYCSASRDGVDFARGDYFTRARFAYEREQFLVRGKLPAPAV